MKSTIALFLTALAFAGIVEGQTTNYSGMCASHTMVKYAGKGPACAPLYLAAPPSAAEITTILAAHNDERSKVARGLETRGRPGPQPPAANMKKLVWDNELATVAQRWAVQCTFGHDTCRNVSRFNITGQNVYVSWSTLNTTASNWAGAVASWIDEVPFFPKTDVSPFKFNSTTGHYSQVVWAKTTTVGCGRSVYKHPTVYPTYITYLYVCNYGPGGNIVGNGTSMYTNGTACSGCPNTGCIATVGLCP